MCNPPAKDFEKGAVSVAGADTEGPFAVVERDGGYYMGAMPVDPKQGFKGKELQLFSFARPHMLSFHFSWASFFSAFVCWFAFAPLMPVVKEALGMSLKQVFAVNIASVTSTVSARFIVGPLVDKLGPKKCQTFLLAWAVVATLLGATVTTVWGLALVRFLVGFAGATFVVTQSWTSGLFVNEIVGTANATAGGWGNLGGGVTYQLMLGTYVGFLRVLSTNNAWRASFIVPAIITATVAITMQLFGDDSPRGDYKVLLAAGKMEKKLAASSMRKGFTNINSWILGVQYGCCFGVELHVNNIGGVYFANRESFGLGPIDGGMVASLFGYMNLFARSVGGGTSDFLAKSMGMRGRLLAQWLMLMMVGVMLVVFGSRTALPGALASLVIFSAFVQAAEGSTFGIVPFVEPQFVGGVSAVVGAWGNIGAMFWGLLFLNQYSSNGMIGVANGFKCMGYIIMVVAQSVWLIRIAGHSHLTGSMEVVDAKADAVNDL
ncbi:major facilitator superfamily domain-containing protein [Pelagophyceae sp. CCMP2097]|nr:major facilitator superfamily domain-containing protein [Pelagophyceae sp. CCMP2097]